MNRCFFCACFVFKCMLLHVYARCVRPCVCWCCGLFVLCVSLCGVCSLRFVVGVLLLQCALSCVRRCAFVVVVCSVVGWIV